MKIYKTFNIKIRNTKISDKYRIYNINNADLEEKCQI